MLHTLSPGAKRIVLPRAADVQEIVNGRKIGRDMGTIEEKLPAGVTRIYRLD